MLSALATLTFIACAPTTESAPLVVENSPLAGVAQGFLPDSTEGLTVRLTPAADVSSLVNPEVPDPPMPPDAIADSAAQFTSVQGMYGWYYGYLEPEGANAFVEASTYVSGGADPGWYALPDGQTWTFLDAETMHPNGEITTGGRESLEQWSVRRWVSTVEATVSIEGELAKYYVDGDSSGVAGYVYVDDVLVWAWYLEGWDDAGVAFDKQVDIKVGSTVDFVLDPWESDDRSDRSWFTAQIFPV